MHASDRPVPGKQPSAPAPPAARVPDLAPAPAGLEHLARLAQVAPWQAGPAGVLRLQRTLGNRAVGRILQGAATAPRGLVQRGAKEDADLFAAVEKDDASAVGKALGAGADIEAVDGEKVTPLQRAAATGKAAALKELISRNAKVDAAGGDGWTALHYAVAFSQEAALPLLLAAGASLKAVTKNGETALAISARATETARGVLLALAAKAGHVPSGAEMERVGRYLYADSALFPADVKVLFQNAFLAVAGKLGFTGQAVLKPAGLAKQLRDYLEMIHDAVAKEVAGGVSKLSTDADRRMAEAATNDLMRVKDDAIRDYSDSPENVLKWLAHLTAQEGSVDVKSQRIQLGGWSPGQALFFKSVGIAELLESTKFSKDEEAYLREELQQDVAAFARAVEIYIVERFFVPMGIPKQVAALLGEMYAKMAAASKEFRIPSGSRMHTTYLTTTYTGQQQVDLVQHNLGRGADKQHVSPGKLRYYPLLVGGVDPGKLAPMFETVILKLVLADGLDTSKTMEELYQALLKQGTVVTQKQTLASQFDPLLAQIANNCSMENLRSVEMETGRRRLKDAYATFADQFNEMQVKLAHGMASKLADATLADEMVGERRYGAQLRAAALEGSADVVAQLIKTHAKLLSKFVDLADSDGHTALHFAASHAYADVVKLLLAAKARPDVWDSNGSVPLHLAAARGDADTVKLLLAAGADFTARDRNGNPPVVAGRKHPAVAKLLLAKYPRRKIKDYYFTPHVAPMLTEPGGKQLGSVELESNEEFHVIEEHSSKKWLRVIHYDGNGTPFVGWISPDKVVDI